MPRNGSWDISNICNTMGSLSSRVVSMLDSGAEGPGFESQRHTLSGNSLRQTVHTHRASVHQAAKLVAALLRVVRVTAGLAESNGSLPPSLWLTSPAGWLPRTGISFATLHLVIEYGLPLPFYLINNSSTETRVECHPLVCVTISPCTLHPLLLCRFISHLMPFPLY